MPVRVIAGASGREDAGVWRALFAVCLPALKKNFALFSENVCKYQIMFIYLHTKSKRKRNGQRTEQH
jgi:hypothetical protein